MSSADLTELLQDWSRGNPDARDQLMPLIYDDLRSIAANQLRGERRGHTLQPTAVVHELYLRLHAQNRVQWKNRRQLFAVAAKLVRRILVDHARKRHADRRGGGEVFLVSIDQVIGLPEEREPELLALDDALQALEQHDERGHQVVEFHIFSGLTFIEIAEVLEVSEATVYRDWDHARLWLRRQLR